MERGEGTAPSQHGWNLAVTITRVDPLVSKTDQVRQALRDGREIDALRIAKSFRILGGYKTAIQRGWDAYTTPSFARALKRDPEELVRSAVQAVRTLYPV